jgi:hypothetical protein
MVGGVTGLSLRREIRTRASVATSSRQTKLHATRAKLVSRRASTSEIRIRAGTLSPARLEEISKTLRDLSSVFEKSKGKRMVVGLKPNGNRKHRLTAVLYK